MSIPQNKTELLGEIIFSYNKLKDEFDNIGENFAIQKNMEGQVKGTKMSLNNLLAYLIGWGELVLKWERKKKKGENVDFPETGYKWNELGKLAQKFYEDYKDLSYIELKDKLDKVVDDILKMINSYSNNELYESLFYEKWTLGRLVQFNTSSPYKNARGRVRKWKKEVEIF